MRCCCWSAVMGSSSSSPGQQQPQHQRGGGHQLSPALFEELTADRRHALRELMTYADMPCGSWWRALLLPISSHGQQQVGSHQLSSALLRR